MTTLVLTDDQRRVLASDEFSGPVTVCSLGLPDREAPVVVHGEDGAAVIEEDGALLRQEPVT